MMDRHPPFKLSVAALLLDGIARTPSAILEDLAGEYAGSRLLTRAHVEEALQSLKTVGIVAIADSGGEREPAYILTRNGKDRVLKAL